MTPPGVSESCIGFSCSRRCSEPLESVQEARDIDFGGLNNFLSFALGTIEVIYKANFRLLGTFGLIAAAEGISKSRRARNTTLSVPLEANIHTECRIHRFLRTRSVCVRTRQDRTPEAKRWSSPAPAPGSESLRAVSMYLTRF